MTSMIDLHEIGTLYEAPTQPVRPGAIQLPVALPGWHVNTTKPVAAWAAWQVTPSSPDRAFAGAVTYYYTFPDRSTYLAQKTEENLADLPKAAVPAVVTMRQARLILLKTGKLASVEAALNALPEPQRSAARIEWDYSNEVQRFNGLIPALGAALSLTPAILDNLFIEASKL